MLAWTNFACQTCYDIKYKYSATVLNIEINQEIKYQNKVSKTKFSYDRPRSYFRLCYQYSL